jgi:transcriptional regulator with XRE-family HTH domain
MLVPVKSVQQLGLLIRAARKAQRVRLDDLAGSAGVGHVFVREVEHGKETVQLGRVLKLLAEVGIELKADLPVEAIDELARLRATGLRPLKGRARPPP